MERSGGAGTETPTVADPQWSAPTKVCPHCGVQAQTTADRCPNCGKKYKRKQRTFLKVMLGVIIGVCVLIAGCAALLAGGVNEAQKDQDKHAITVSQFRDVNRGSTEQEVREQLGVEPGDAQEFENEGLPGQAVKSSCIYYNEKGKDLGEGKFFQFCFDNGKLTAKNAY